ncbi:MAG: hypothetical protein KC619_19835 [Myxococcales bacterium]|nr:hypothetical protein [Myxococcales bacterium]
MRSLFVSLALAGVLGFSSLVQAQGTDQIEIVEPGNGPREPLRHRFVAGLTQPVTLRVQSQMRMALGSRIQMIPMPVLRMDIRFGPTEVTNGHLRYPYEITGVGISGGESEGMNERVREQINGLIGTHGIAEIDERGAVVDFSYELPDGASRDLQNQSRMLRDSLAQLVPRFPDEPIGVGGSWRVIHDLPLPNMTVRVGTTYRLVSRHGDLIELDINTAVMEDAPNPARIDVSGSGRLRFQIGTLRTFGRVQTVAAAEIRGPQGPMRMRIRSRMQITAAE